MSGAVSGVTAMECVCVDRAEFLLDLVEHQGNVHTAPFHPGFILHDHCFVIALGMQISHVLLFMKFIVSDVHKDWFTQGVVSCTVHIDVVPQMVK